MYDSDSPKNRTKKGAKDGKHFGQRYDGADGNVCGCQNPVREPQGYRQTIEWLSEKTEKGWLSTTEIAALLGIDRHTVSRRFGITRGCALPILAKKLAEESR